MVNISKMVVMRLKTMKSTVRISGNVVLTIMDQCPYEFGTRGHCKKVNNARPLQLDITNVFVFKPI